MQRASGTKEKAVFNEISVMLDTLYRTGKHEVLQEIQSKGITPMEVYGLYQSGKLDTTVSTRLFKPIYEHTQHYLENAALADVTKRVYTNLLERFNKKFVGRSLKELPSLLDMWRRECIRTRKGARSFNQMRAMFQGMVHRTPGLGQHHPLWAQIANVSSIPTKPKKIEPLDVKEYLQLRNALEHDNERDMLDALIFTGMRKSEYYDKMYEMKPDHIVVNGTKTDGSRRVVPRLIHVMPSQYPQGFERSLRAKAAPLFNRRVFPHALRHSFAHWLEMANIPDTRRRLYMGHAGDGMTGRYSWHKVEKFVIEDAATFQKWYKRQLK